jgi:glyoxylase-like metal-dependent hydrolase (beta-lactamase superfamily II)
LLEYCLLAIFQRFFTFCPKTMTTNDSRQNNATAQENKAPSALKIFPIEAGPVATWGYLLTDGAAGCAVVIDAPMGCKDFFLRSAAAEGCKITDILLTHSHWDHTGDAAALQRATGAPVWVHADDDYRLREPNKYTGFPLPFQIEASPADRFLTPGETYRCGDWELAIVHTPGHTEGGVCFIEKRRKLAFVGDTLFAGSVGRTDLPGGDTATLLRSIRERLFTLDDDCVVLPGHGERTRIGVERRANPFLR